MLRVRRSLTKAGSLPGRYQRNLSAIAHQRMGKNNKKRVNLVNEKHLLLPPHPSLSGVSPSIIDTHTHIAPTFSWYKKKYKERNYESCFDFIRGMCKDRNVKAIVDVWCDAPVSRLWKEYADSALTTEG
jgi:TatD DNase family protein